jgi:hypothetical protein
MSHAEDRQAEQARSHGRVRAPTRFLHQIDRTSFRRLDLRTERVRLWSLDRAAVVRNVRTPGTDLTVVPLCISS